jgi:hypothetical protein
MKIVAAENRRRLLYGRFDGPFNSPEGRRV